MNQVIKCSHTILLGTPQYSMLLYLHVHVKGLFFSKGKKFRYSLNYSEKQVRKAAHSIVNKNMGTIIPQKKKALELLAV